MAIISLLTFPVKNCQFLTTKVHKILQKLASTDKNLQ